MSTVQVPFERRVGQRFETQVAVCVRVPGRGLSGTGFTQDVSARGIFLFADVPLSVGDAVEITLTMPAEIFSGEATRVRGHGRVLRALPSENTQRVGAAVLLERYEYLPAEDMLPAIERLPALSETDEVAIDRW